MPFLAASEVFGSCVCREDYINWEDCVMDLASSAGLSRQVAGGGKVMPTYTQLCLRYGGSSYNSALKKNTQKSCGKSEEVLKISENSPKKWNIKIREIVSNLIILYRKKILDSFVSQCLQYLRFHPKVTVYDL